MTCYKEITCPNCGGNYIKKAGLNSQGEQRYRCQNTECPTMTFMLAYRYRAYEPGIKQQAVEMAIKGSGIRDTARVLKINKNTVISTLKKKSSDLVQVNPELSDLSAGGGLEVRLEVAFEAEIDEQWSYVGKKSNQRWLWYAVDHATNTVLAYVFGKRCLRSSKAYCVHFVLPATTQMIGVPMNAIWIQINMRLANETRKKSNART